MLPILLSDTVAARPVHRDAYLFDIYRTTALMHVEA